MGEEMFEECYNQQFVNNLLTSRLALPVQSRHLRTMQFLRSAPQS